MSVTKYFTWRETEEGNFARCIIVPKDYDKFPFNTKHGGSYGVAPARVLGLSYATYLRFIRDMFPDVVSLEGKNSRYVTAYWKKGKELYTFVDLLNAKLTKAVLEAKHGHSTDNS